MASCQEVGVEAQHTPTGDLPPLASWWLVVQGLAFATPHPQARHTQPPTPVSQPHSLRHSKTHESLPGGPKQRPRTRSPGTGPYRSSGLIRRAGGSESARGNYFMTLPWPPSCSQPNLGAQSPSASLSYPQSSCPVGPPFSSPSIISRRNQLKTLG